MSGGILHIVEVLVHQWKAIVFLVLPLSAMAYNFLPDPLELLGCCVSKYSGRGIAEGESSLCWSWDAFEAAVKRDDRRLAGGEHVGRPMTKWKARVLYTLFGHERVPFRPK
mmetsp:Transcript_55899/g.120947  ORF Transcript_55899/g.120947 Transcript_55899/m.120947 type:complete len:111 (-) Transcript_55899:66-398(-)